MKTKTKNIKYLIGSFLLLISIILLSWKTESFEPSILKSKTKENTSNSRFTSKELFKGIMFFEGNVADLIPQIKNIKDKQIFVDRDIVTKIKAYNDIKMRCLEAKYPGYIDEFSKDISSKDLKVIENRISDAQQKLSSVLFDISKSPNTYLQIPSMSTSDKNIINEVSSASNSISNYSSSSNSKPPCGIAILVRYVGIIADAMIAANTIIANISIIIWELQPSIETLSMMENQKMLVSISELN